MGRISVVVNFPGDSPFQYNSRTTTTIMQSQPTTSSTELTMDVFSGTETSSAGGVKRRNAEPSGVPRRKAWTKVQHYSKMDMLKFQAANTSVPKGIPAFLLKGAAGASGSR